MLHFYDIINTIKHKIRAGWTARNIPDAHDSIASHSYGASLIGWVMAREEGLDADRVIKMLHVHDLIMAYIPDIRPQDPEYSQKPQLEKASREKLLKDVPHVVRREFDELLKEYEERKTPESILANECDGLDAVLQSRKYDPHHPGTLESHLSTQRVYQFKSTQKLLEEIKNS